MYTPRRNRKRTSLRKRLWLALALVALVAVAYRYHGQIRTPPRLPLPLGAGQNGPAFRQPADLNPFQRAVLSDLDRQIALNITYKDGYYIGGDPPQRIGVCSDVVVRSFRAAGVDLQSEVATDIRRAPDSYHIGKPDRNIDHRRCRNLAVFFRRHAKMLPATGTKADWEPADIVVFDCTGNGYPNHIAVIANAMGDSGLPLIVQHLPGYPVIVSDGLNQIPVLYHFRWPYTAHRRIDRRIG